MALTEENIESFFSKTSFMGLCSIYALTLSKEKNIAFNLNDLTSKAFPSFEGYFHGFIIACASFELTSFNLHNGIITVESIKLTSARVKGRLTIGYLNIANDYKEGSILKIEEYFR